MKIHSFNVLLPPETLFLTIQKMKNQHNPAPYCPPVCEAVELKLEGVIALSGLSDYEDGGDL